jgi:hypothetical protein
MKALQIIGPTLLVLAAALGSATAQQSASTEPSDAPQVRQEIQLIEHLLPHLPDRAPALFQLAHDYTYLGDRSKGLSLLKQCLALREGFDPTGDPALSRLQGSPEYDSLVAKVHTDFPAVAHASPAFRVAETDLIPEGLAVDTRTHVFYMSSLNRKKIVRITADGTVSDFITAGQYNAGPICGIKVDVNSDVWANACHYDGVSAELLHFDHSGKLLERFGTSEPGTHFFNDLVLVKADTIYLTDSFANKVYRVNRKTHAFTPLSFPRALYYPNGIALSENGSWLYVSDAFGTLQYNLHNQTSREIIPGPLQTVSGFDGLYCFHNSLVGIQNSLGTARVVAFHLSTDGGHITSMHVLENSSGFVESPTTGAIEGSRFYFMENANIANYNEGKITDPQKQAPVRIGVLDLKE